MCLRRSGSTIACRLLAILGAAGCAGEDGTGGRDEVFDSAGVTITQSYLPQWAEGEAWRVGAEPLLDLSETGSGSEHEFERLAGAMRLEDGSIVVANGGSAEVRFFSSDGVFEVAVGREGDGPGEFRRLRSVHRYRGDSVAVFDSQARRVTVIDAGRSVARIATFGVGSTEDVHVLSNGDFVLRESRFAVEESVQSPSGSPQLFVVTSPAGILRGTIVVATGYGESAVGADRLIVGDAYDSELRTYSLDGSLRRIVRVMTTPPPAMEGHEPVREPAYSDLLVDSEGYYWISEYYPSEGSKSSQGWLVFSPDGVWLGTVGLPPGFDVMEVGTDYVLGSPRGKSETIQLLRLVR